MDVGNLIFGSSALVVKNPPADAGDAGSIPELERSGEGNGIPFQYSCLENPTDREAWWPTSHRVTENSDMTENAHTQGVIFQSILLILIDLILIVTL